MFSHRAIDPVRFTGNLCDLDGVYRLAKKQELRAPDDAMHAFGSPHKGRKINSFGNIIWFGFDPVNIVTAVDGGCVVVNSGKEPHDLQRLRLPGVKNDPTEHATRKALTLPLHLNTKVEYVKRAVDAVVSFFR